MKKWKLFTNIIILMLVLSCSSDDDAGQAFIGELIVDGQSHGLTKGFLLPNYNGDDPNFNARRFYIILTNGDVTLNNNDFSYANNITQLIDFNLYTSVSAAGAVQYTTYPVYDFNDPDFDFNDAFIDHAAINTDVVIQNNQYVSANSLSTDDMTGQATLSQNNGMYTVSFSFTNADHIVSGHFTGNLTELDYQY